MFLTNTYLSKRHLLSESNPSFYIHPTTVIENYTLWTLEESRFFINRNSTIPHGTPGLRLHISPNLRGVLPPHPHHVLSSQNFLKSLSHTVTPVLPFPFMKSQKRTRRHLLLVLPSTSDTRLPFRRPQTVFFRLVWTGVGGSHRRPPGL